MNKPLKDWTLAEAKNYALSLDCDNRTDSECRECKLFGICAEAAEIWNLEEVPKWTEEEKDLAKALKKLFPNATYIRKNKYLRSSNLGVYKTKEHANAYISVNSFPTLEEQYNYVKLDDIIGE